MLFEQNLARGGLDYIENTSRVKKKRRIQEVKKFLNKPIYNM